MSDLPKACSAILLLTVGIPLFAQQAEPPLPQGYTTIHHSHIYSHIISGATRYTGSIQICWQLSRDLGS